MVNISYILKGIVWLARAALPPFTSPLSLNFFNMPSSTYSLTHSLKTYQSVVSNTQRSPYVFVVLKWSSNACAVSTHLTELLFPHSPDAWTSVTYCSNSCPWWMTSKVRLFIVSALSAWCCSLCSASVRSSVSKSLICWDSSSFHDSRSEMIWEGDGKSETRGHVNSQILREKNYFLITPEKDKNTRYLATIISTSPNIKRKSKALQSHAVISLSI